MSNLNNSPLKFAPCIPQEPDQKFIINWMTGKLQLDANPSFCVDVNTGVINSQLRLVACANAAVFMRSASPNCGALRGALECAQAKARFGCECAFVGGVCK